MNKSVQYRQYANECRVLAQRVSIPDAKAQLLKVAAGWDALAAEHDRRSAFDQSEISPLQRAAARVLLSRDR